MKRRLKKAATRIRQALATEDQEQKLLVQWLNLKGVRHFMVPNEAALKAARGCYPLMNHLKAMGLLPGAPDLILIPKNSHGNPTVVEMKRAKPKGKVTDNQLDVHAELNWHSWCVVIGYGAEDAIAKLEALGY